MAANISAESSTCRCPAPRSKSMSSPALGTQVTLGTMRGQVVRHFEDGVAIEFAVVQRAESLEVEFSSDRQL
jgi:hypothetical protein